MPGAEITVYLHGTPGSPLELSLGGAGVPAGWYAPDRNDPDRSGTLDKRLDALARQIEVEHPSGPLRLVGFSLGAMIALRLAPRLGQRVQRIDLVAAAAPLEGGDFLPFMAGRAVFTAAWRMPLAFALLARAQSWLARTAPGWLVKQLFASAAGDDSGLAASAQFQGALRAIVQAGLGRSGGAYRAEITGYVAPWADALAKVKAPVHLWHGTHDNWTPPAMTDYLAASLPNLAALHHLEGRSHYSALVSFLEQQRE